MRCFPSTHVWHCLPQCMLVFVSCICGGFAAEQLAWRDVNRQPHAVDIDKMPKLPTGKIGKTVIQKSAGITFNVTYMDVVNQSGIGFDDPNFGADRRDTAEAVCAYLNLVLNEDGICNVLFKASETDGTGALAFASSYMSSRNATFGPTIALLHIRAAYNDPNPGGEDINVTTDFGYMWNSELDPPASYEFDLFTVLLHELTHGLGITSMSDQDGVGLPISGSIGIRHIFTSFDAFLYSGNNVKVWNTYGTFQGTSAMLTGANGGIQFRGPGATAAFGGVYPPVFAPSLWDNGSSLSHWDDALVSPDALMEHAISPGVMHRKYQPFELAALRDISYELRVNAVTSWAQYE